LPSDSNLVLSVCGSILNLGELRRDNGLGFGEQGKAEHQNPVKYNGQERGKTPFAGKVYGVDSTIQGLEPRATPLWVTISMAVMFFVRKFF